MSALNIDPECGTERRRMEPLPRGHRSIQSITGAGSSLVLVMHAAQADDQLVEEDSDFRPVVEKERGGRMRGVADANRQNAAIAQAKHVLVGGIVADVD